MGLFSAMGVNSRKRGREAIEATFPPLPTKNLFSLQHQRPSQTLVSTALGLDINGHQQQQQQIHIMPFSTFSSFTTEEDLAAQTDQIDQIIQTHGDHLRRTLAGKYQRHCRALLGAAEESVAKRLREKDVEIEKAVRRNAELEQRVAHFSMEAQVWRDKARTLEGTASSLRTAMQQAMMRGGSPEEGERLWCTVGGEAQVEDAESSYVDPEGVGPVEWACKACRNRAASVMMWPCRHLCVCMKCNAAVEACPVCQTLKTTSVEVYLS